jgi:hypothetical protein
MEAAPTAWSVSVPDRVVALAAGGGMLTAVSHDGSLSTIDRSGKLLASKPLSAAELQEAVKQHAAPADPRADEALKSQARSDRLAKLAAATSDRIAVVYWGGTLRVVDAQGTIRSEQTLPQDVTALTWLDGVLVAGLADGRVIALQAK